MDASHFLQTEYPGKLPVHGSKSQPAQAVEPCSHAHQGSDSVWPALLRLGDPCQVPLGSSVPNLVNSGDCSQRALLSVLPHCSGT